MTIALRAQRAPLALLLLLLLVTGRASAGSATLAWDPVISPALTGYVLHYGTSAGSYTSKIDVGNTTTRTVQGLGEGGTYHFAVTAYDASRIESAFSNDVTATVPFAAPIADFTASTTSGVAPLALNFTSTSAGDITGYGWNFGDGTTSTARAPSHVYSTAGIFTVSLTVAGPGGSNTTTKANFVSVRTLATTTATLSATPNPSFVGTLITLMATIGGNAPTGTVQFTDSGATIAGCAAVALSGSGNVRTATCRTTVVVAGTHGVVARYVGDGANAPATSAPVNEVVNAGSGSINVALAANGGVASASSTYSAGFSPTEAIDGRHSGAVWGISGGWNNGSYRTFPDWLQVTFNGKKTIDHIVVYSVQDDYQNPVEPTDSMTFTRYGLTSFDVQAWNGLGWVTVARVRGNNLVKRTVSFPAYATDRIRIYVIASVDGNWARITEVEAWTPAAASSQIDVALASNGATATASSTYGAGFGATEAIDGRRSGAVWGVSGGWNDATLGAIPDWLQIDFNATRTIDHVVVYSVQDDYRNPVEPTDSMITTRYGLASFEVQAWNGSTWVTLASVSGNNLVKRSVQFSPYSTDRIRIYVKGTQDGRWSRITEVEAWGQ